MLKLSKIHILFALILILIVAFFVGLIPYIQMGINSWQQRVKNSQYIPPTQFPTQTNQVVTQPTPTELSTYDLKTEQGRFVSEINQLLLAKNFRKIDEIARELRISKKRFANGRWALNRLYSGLESIFAQKPDQVLTEDDWKERIALLESWKKQRPESPTARIALANIWVGYGWFARGSGFINTVSEANQALLDVRLGNAEAELIEARELSEKCPQWYDSKLFIAMANGMPQDEYDSLFNEAIRFEPSYFPYYFAKSEKLKPKWGGRPGDWQKFVDSIPNILAKHNSDEGNIIYLHVIIRSEGDQDLTINFNELSQEQIRQGFIDASKKFTADKSLLNSYARLAVFTFDTPSAKEAFKQIGDNPDTSVWSKETYTILRREVESGRIPHIVQK